MTYEIIPTKKWAGKVGGKLELLMSADDLIKPYTQYGLKLET
jgi:hypothetical protein